MSVFFGITMSPILIASGTLLLNGQKNGDAFITAKICSFKENGKQILKAIDSL